MSTLLTLLAVLVVSAGLYLVVVGLARRPARAGALDHLRDDAPPGPRDERLAQPLVVRLTGPVVARLSGLGRRIAPRGRSDNLRRRLDQAGMTLPVEAFLAGRAVTAGVGLLVAVGVVAVAGPSGAALLAVLAGGAGLGAAAPGLLVLSRAQERQARIDRELPEALDLMALTVRAGLGLEQSISHVAAELTGPLGAELDRSLKEQQLGRSRREALESLRGRTSSDDLASLVSALLHADRLGTPIADTLSVQARELRRRRRAAARERAGKAPVKLLFPMIFGIFPAMFVVIVGPAILSIVDALFQ